MKQTLVHALENKVASLKEMQVAKRAKLNEEGTVDLSQMAIGIVTAIVALIVAVIVAGNLDTATATTVSNTSSWYPLLATISTYGSTSITLVAIGLIVAGASAILWIVRGGF